MPNIGHTELKYIVSNLLVAAGASEDEASTVAEHTVGANLAGHDSHGVIQIPTYIDRINANHIVPGAPFEILKDTSTTTVVDGHWGFGYVVSKRVMDMTIEKARTANVAAATVFRQSHVGRVANYPVMAADAGMIGMMTADSGRSPKHVAPFGGREARLGTNPICFAIPSNLEGPFFIDMASSAVAAGKINLAIARGSEIPPGWIIDKDGHPSTDPRDYPAGGTLLPLGGPEGYKGYGLSATIEVFSGILTGLGFGIEPSGRHNDGCFMVAFNVEAFRPLDEFKHEVAEFAEYLTSTPPATGFERVYYPGELEHLSTQRSIVEGIDVEEETWSSLRDLAISYSIDSDLGL